MPMTLQTDAASFLATDRVIYADALIAIDVSNPFGDANALRGGNPD